MAKVGYPVQGLVATVKDVVGYSLLPRPLEGRGKEGLIFTACACMCQPFCKNARKSFHTLIPTTCWWVKRSTCLKNMGWPPDLYTSTCAKRVPTAFGGLHRWTRKHRSKLKLSKPAISMKVERKGLRSNDKYTTKYPYVIRLFKIWII